MQVEQKGVGKRIEAALHFRQTLSEKLPSARSKCIFCMFVIGHVFFGENVEFILSKVISIGICFLHVGSR